ncbi:MAG: TRAP transporter substrate-binding protein [Acetobacteraceae bacterium]|nr:TRAP transporter substrate-binding protein [Acetobacteraceae bacterium]
MTRISRRGVLGGGGSIAVALGLGRHRAVGDAHAQGKEEFKLKLATDLPMAHPVNTRLQEAVAAIGSETDGRVAITLFPNNQLGSDSDMLSQIRSGGLELATFPSTVLSTMISTAAITGVGFAFTSYDQVWKAMDGALGNAIRRAIEKTNLHPFEAAWDNGFREITSSTRPINRPEDLKGFKIRVPVVPLWVSMFSSLGAAPVSIPLSEAYSALQTKVADGQENPLVLIDLAKFYEVQKYCSLTNHAWDGFWLIANGRVWRTIPADVQQIMAKHFDAAARKQREDNVRLSADVQKSLEGKGLKFNTVDPAPFQAALKSSGFYKQARDKF